MTIKIAGLQMTPQFADRTANLAVIEAGMKSAAQAGAMLAVFPEAAVTGYCFDSLEEAIAVAEPVPGESVERLTATCKSLGTHVIYGTLERACDKIYNAALLVGPRGLVGKYRKVHLPFLGVDRFASHGDLPFAVHQAGELRVGMLICYDGSFPEATRCLALAGADLIALPTNWPPKSECAAEHLTNARAMENAVYFAAVNRVGEERGFRFIGGSRIADPSGVTLADAMHTNEAMLLADVDPQRSRTKHLIRIPGKHEINRFADRRPEMYGRLVAPVENPSARR